MSLYSCNIYAVRYTHNTKVRGTIGGMTVVSDKINATIFVTPGLDGRVVDTLFTMFAAVTVRNCPLRCAQNYAAKLFLNLGRGVEVTIESLELDYRNGSKHSYQLYPLERFTK